jgi:Na+-transporting methylmalonyl-CoA/oxaloacetate decarboxylase gamma subunit
LVLGIVGVVIVLLILAFAIWGGGMTIGDAGYEDRPRSLDADRRLWEPEPHTKDREPSLESRVLARPNRQH